MTAFCNMRLPGASTSVDRCRINTFPFNHQTWTFVTGYKIDNKKMKDRTYDGGFIEPCPLSSLQQYSNKITTPSVQLLFFSLQKIPSN